MTEHTHNAPVGSPFVRGCPACEAQWVESGLGPIERMKPLGYRAPIRELAEPSNDPNEAAWDRADHEVERDRDAMFTLPDFDRSGIIEPP